MGGTFSDETPPDFPTTGKAMGVRVHCSHTGTSVDVFQLRGCRVTSDWTAAHLHEALEQQAGVHRLGQTLMFAGRAMEPSCTLQSLMGSKPEQLPDRLALFLHVDRESFPQRLGPFRPVRVPFEAEDFVLPELTEELRRAGFYWELKTGVLESYGLRARFPRITGQVSPAHPVPEDAAWRQATCVPDTAQEIVWSYPVAGWECVESDAYALERWEGLEASAALKSFLTVGGFLFFDAEGRIAGATTPGRLDPGEAAGLHFLQSKRWRPEWTRPLAEHGRFQPVTMRSLVQLGAKLFCWLRPQEVLEDGDGQPLPVQPEVPHGGFVYLFHDDVMSKSSQETALDRYFAVSPSCDCAEAEEPTPKLFRPFSLVGDELAMPYGLQDAEVARPLQEVLQDVREEEPEDSELDFQAMSVPQSPETVKSQASTPSTASSLRH
mmetsp:Transcript_109869/g.354715  ORF Transcript_109869/g.354715 Transcript_109869/m.354715 type:complete len:436 (+) Transcript_109869:117-1424(+)